MTDMVNHPPHYKSGGLEAIDVLEAFFPDDPLGWQVGKYILRYRKKNGLEDLKKAQWYLNRLIDKFEGDAVPMNERAVPTDELVWTDFADVPPGTLVSCDNDILWLLRTKDGLGWWVTNDLLEDEIAALKDQRDGWGITPELNEAGPFRFKAHV